VLLELQVDLAEAAVERGGDRPAHGLNADTRLGAAS
jgi:hypothetical protein